MKTAKRNSWTGKQSRLQWLILPLLAVLLAAAVFLVWNYVTGETSEPLAQPAYQYFLDQRVEYEEDTAILVGEDGVIFQNGEERNESDPSPIYFQERDALLLTEDMSWLDPATGVEWRLSALGSLELDGDGNIWYQDVNGEDPIHLDGGFLNSGRGTYVFLEDTTLRFNGLAYRLAPFSFYSVARGMYRVYQYGEDVMTAEAERERNTTATVERGYEMDLTAGIYTAVNGRSQLLVASPYVLKSIAER